MKTPKAPQTVSVPAADPRHPRHFDWLAILQAAAAIGPVVVAIVSPENASMANQLGQVATSVLTPKP